VITSKNQWRFPEKLTTSERDDYGNDVAAGWSDDGGVRRWRRLSRLRDKSGKTVRVCRHPGGNLEEMKAAAGPGESTGELA
jgi:hypothetical protein